MYVHMYMYGCIYLYVYVCVCIYACIYVIGDDNFKFKTLNIWPSFFGYSVNLAVNLQ